jgi:hypothetical protein
VVITTGGGLLVTVVVSIAPLWKPIDSYPAELPFPPFRKLDFLFRVPDGEGARAAILWS